MWCLWSFLVLANNAMLTAGKKDSYSSNAVCLRHKCINPIFPAFRLLGVNVLEQQETRTFGCVADWKNVKRIARFCREALEYEFSIPTDGKAADVLVAEDHKAALAYVSHLNGMGIDTWDFPKPWAPEAPECVREVWKLACYTYFPKCNELDNTKYLRPCKTTCEWYIAKCGIECCDEGTKCIFSHEEVSATDGSTVTAKGYVNHESPSVLCTGMFPSNAAQRGCAPSWFLIILLLAASMLFQGCDRYGGYIIPKGPIEGIPGHDEAYWRQQPDYTETVQIIKKKDGTATLNSCMTPGISSVHVCSGNGHCMPWDPDDIAHPFLICECHYGWAGQECNVKRYSQVVAWNLSLFLGFLGADQFYLGYAVYAIFKLLTLGGFGILWLFDIANIGSGTIYAINFRVKNDFPHWLYVILSVSIFITIGFICSFMSIYKTVRERRKLAVVGRFPG